MDTEDVKRIWRNADAVMLDVDSTLIQELAIHELAKFCGKENSVLNLATLAMQREMPFKEALKGSMDLIRPTKQQIIDFNDTRSLNLSLRAKDLILLLNKRKTPLYLVSGSFKPLILPLAKELSIPEERIFANEFKFFYNGDFAGYKDDAPTTEETGKRVIAKMLKEENGYQNLVNIGDGYTDLEACPPSDAFIGYGGNVVRNYVKQGAKWYITDFDELIKELKKGNSK